MSSDDARSVTAVEYAIIAVVMSALVLTSNGGKTYTLVH